MTDDNKKENVEETVSIDAYKALMEQLNVIKENSVSSKEHEEIVARMKLENETLVKGLAENRPFRGTEQKIDKEAELKKVTEKILNESYKDDVDMIETHLTQRKLMIDVMGIDPMVGLTPKSGNQAVITPAKAEEIAKGLTELVEYAKENNISFQKANDIKKIVDHSDIRLNNKKESRGIRNGISNIKRQ